MDGTSVNPSTLAAGIESPIDKRGVSSDFPVHTDISLTTEGVGSLVLVNDPKAESLDDLDPRHSKDAQTQTGNKILRKGILKRPSGDAQSADGSDPVSAPHSQLLDEGTPLTAEPDAPSNVGGVDRSTQTIRIRSGGFSVDPEDEAKGRKHHVTFNEKPSTRTIREEDVTRTEES